MEKVILLADKNSNSWNFAEKIKDYIFDKWKEEIQLNEVNVDYFRNREMDLNVPKNLRKRDVYFIHDASKNPQDWWVQLLLLKDLLIRASAETITFVLPHMAYTRKDWKDQPHVSISAKVFADSISNGVERIITMDLHSPQIQGFYSIPVDNLYSFPDASRYLHSHHTDNLEELVIVSPDAGGVSRARAFAQKLKSKYPIAFIEKRRPEAGEIAEMRLAGDVKDKNVLVVDDIIDSGGTLIKASELLKKEGARQLMCYGTHAVCTENADLRLLEVYDNVIVSNTIPCKLNEKVEVVDVSKTFGETIYRAQKGLSISELFG